MTNVAEISERLKPCIYSGEDRPKLSRLFGAEYDGRKWAAATDGHMLALVPFDGELPNDGPDLKSILPTKKLTHISSRAELLEAAGEPEVSPCGNCGGGGKCDGCRCDAEHACGDCKGTGSVSVLRYAAMLVGVVNADLLKRLISTAPDAAIVVSQSDEKSPYLFRSTDWAGALAPVRMETAGLRKIALRVRQ